MLPILLVGLPVWEAWSAPSGQWSSLAFPVLTPLHRVYVVDGRRVWRRSREKWEEWVILPEEVRSGVAWSEDTLILGGLNAIHIISGRSVYSLVLSGAGWIHRLWESNRSVMARGAQRSFSVTLEPGAWKALPLDREIVGVSSENFLWRKGDTIGEKNQVLLWERTPFLELYSTRGKVWAIGEKGKIRALGGGDIRLKGAARFWSGSYLIEDRKALRWPDGGVVWEGTASLLGASAQKEAILLLEPSRCILLYDTKGIGWRYRWKQPVSRWATANGGEIVVWHGEQAWIRGEWHAYPATLLDATRYNGRWIWATPIGLLSENGEVFAAKGLYITSVAAYRQHLCWAVGKQLFWQQGASPPQTYTFPAPIRRLAWLTGNLWVWTGDALYTFSKGKWQGYRLSLYAEDSMPYNDAWYFRMGAKWLRWSPSLRIDTLSVPPWLEDIPSFPHAWGKPLASFRSYSPSLILTSEGLLEYSPELLKITLELHTLLRGTSLQQTSQSYQVSAAMPYIELQWTAHSSFLTSQIEVYYTLNQHGWQKLEQPVLLLSLTEPGQHTLQLKAVHPWSTRSIEKSYSIEVLPLWYQSWTFRVALILGIVGLIAGSIFLREWHFRRLRLRLAEEREALMRQTQQQQTQLLRAERMANLGLMAAHIAHEINTPLGVIRSSSTELLQALERLMGSYPLPAEPRPNANRMRELREAWRQSYPNLSLATVQMLAGIGYLPTQADQILPLIAQDTDWSLLQSFLLARQAAERVQEAAEKLHNRVQAIRTYVRGMEDTPLVPVSLAESLQATLTFYRPLMRKVEASLELPETPLYVLASPARLEQVWANLIQNALQAMPEGGKLSIRVQSSNGTAHIFFQDSGKGIPPALREKIFEPLFTTKAPGEGTGLGLPLCRQIVESYKGSLALLHSEPGYTLFRVILPLAESPWATPS
ncbi:MAG: ATP-binding protein [Bacteroidia bacterium]|nr:ATP-binding protein [Bacteroidia bacterium]MDW8235319.1 ATP-binding protein [Bacteroidia bacterium]